MSVNQHWRSTFVSRVRITMDGCRETMRSPDDVLVRRAGKHERTVCGETGQDKKKLRGAAPSEKKKHLAAMCKSEANLSERRSMSRACAKVIPSSETKRCLLRLLENPRRAMFNVVTCELRASQLGNLRYDGRYCTWHRCYAECDTVCSDENR